MSLKWQKPASKSLLHKSLMGTFHQWQAEEKEVASLKIMNFTCVEKCCIAYEDKQL